MTSVDGVFASGGKSVVHAMAAGAESRGGDRPLHLRQVVRLTPIHSGERLAPSYPVAGYRGSHLAPVGPRLSPYPPRKSAISRSRDRPIGLRAVHLFGSPPSGVAEKNDRRYLGNEQMARIQQRVGDEREHDASGQRSGKEADSSNRVERTVVGAHLLFPWGRGSRARSTKGLQPDSRRG